jgi:hypothetical protein
MELSAGYHVALGLSSELGGYGYDIGNVGILFSFV